MPVEELYLQATREETERTIAALHRELAAERALKAERKRREPAAPQRTRSGGFGRLVRALADFRPSRMRA